MFWGEELILKDLSQLNFTASQVFKSLKYYDFQFIKSKNSRCLMVALVLHNDKKELPEVIRKELKNKGILILDNPRFIIHNNSDGGGVCRRGNGRNVRLSSDARARQLQFRAGPGDQIRSKGSDRGISDAACGVVREQGRGDRGAGSVSFRDREGRRRSARRERLFLYVARGGEKGRVPFARIRRRDVGSGGI